jgi:hypothetical protein
MEDLNKTSAPMKLLQERIENALEHISTPMIIAIAALLEIS